MGDLTRRLRKRSRREPEHGAADAPADQRGALEPPGQSERSRQGVRRGGATRAVGQDARPEVASGVDREGGDDGHDREADPEQEEGPPVLGAGEHLFAPADRVDPRRPRRIEREGVEVRRAGGVAGGTQDVGADDDRGADPVRGAAGRGELAHEHADAEERDAGDRERRARGERTGAIHLAGGERAREQEAENDVRDHAEHERRGERRRAHHGRRPDQLAPAELFVGAAVPRGEERVHEPDHDGQPGEQLEPHDRSGRRS
ncbi:hypothetical protein GCM10025881_19290 [Pseudolysinimonas kribbensis]|uniref:Uncharacterized protein n=1 Tax=Pseudolysinimonas kribbensis TaxID=433641 RepID=A0ABQ6K671_9MICO|nr:hypothetical protein [Pseudolysinimonas kribbensis]GMA95105.1 hypothetical protein GCM10025881_19290 [Pseudolysinimonas kribbensis]